MLFKLLKLCFNNVLAGRWGSIGGDARNVNVVHYEEVAGSHKQFPALVSYCDS